MLHSHAYCPWTQAEAFESVRDGGGHCVVVGGVPEGQNLSIYPGHLLNGRALTGCLFGGYRFRNDLPSLVSIFAGGPHKGVVEMIAEGKIPVDDYITGSFKLAEINKAMDTMRSANGAVAVKLDVLAWQRGRERKRKRGKEKRREEKRREEKRREEKRREEKRREHPTLRRDVNLEMDASNSWQNIVHTHCGLKEIQNQSLNATLQILFHIPPFLKLLENGDHSCADCVFCRVRMIWECVKKGTVDINLNSGDYYNALKVVSCAACKTSKSIPELLLCLQVKIDCAVNLQEAINNAFLSKARPCGKCSYHILIVTMLSKHPSILFVRPITSTKTNVGFRIDETIEVSCNKYKIIGAILDGKKAVVRCPNSNLISIENKKIRSISWSKFLECETGEVSSILIYENITPKVNETSKEIPHHSTPVLDKTIDSEDQHQVPKASRSKARRKLYEESPSLQSSTHKFSRSASKLKYIGSSLRGVRIKKYSGTSRFQYASTTAALIFSQCSLSNFTSTISVPFLLHITKSQTSRPSIPK
ncbi:hypothetical protein FOCC_FOCC008027 [Frankliniella occidentalis]|nr:hypothetical protein FOCC_FOCC008027 [Frankliniella occidentalis]